LFKLDTKASFVIITRFFLFNENIPFFYYMNDQISMETAIQKAGILLEALPYIKRFKDKIVIIKFGGSAMSDDQTYCRTRYL